MLLWTNTTREILRNDSHCFKIQYGTMPMPIKKTIEFLKTNELQNIPIPKIVINLKSETTEEETLRIAENLQNFMEKEEYGKLLEVEIK